MNFCFIGCGNLANIVAKEFKKTGRHNIVSVYSRTQEHAAKFCAKYGGTPYTDIEAAARNEAVEGIYIVSPHGVHYPQLKQLIEIKKPILCEKAFTINAEQASEIIKLAKLKKVLVVEAMWMLFNPNIIQAKEIAISGELGNIKRLTASFCFDHKITHMFSRRERMTDLKLGAGALLDVTVYPIALSYYFLGYPYTAFANLQMKSGYDTTDQILLKNKSAVVSDLTGSIEKFTIEKAVITFEKGTIEIPDFHKAKQFTVISKTGKKTYKNDNSYIIEFDKFEEDWKNGLLESSVMKHKYTYDIMRIMDACRAQANFRYPRETEKL